MIDGFLGGATSKSRLYIPLNPDVDPPQGRITLPICRDCQNRILNNMEEETDGFIVVIP